MNMLVVFFFCVAKRRDRIECYTIRPLFINDNARMDLADHQPFSSLHFIFPSTPLSTTGSVVVAWKGSS
jgi:hypothetical protein